MNPHFAHIAFTRTVRDTQRQLNGREIGRARPEELSAALHREVALGERERQFIAARDSFYLATVSETGWPHVQHRGGAVGFLRVLDAHTLAFADYPGNRQYVSVGNLRSNPRAALIMLDYVARRRLKLFAEIEPIAATDAPAALIAALALPPDQPFERVMVLHLKGFDWNCSQYISPRPGA